MKSKSEIQKEIDANIQMAVNPIGDSTSLRERDRAVHLLLTYGKIAYDRLIQLIYENPKSMEAPVLIEIVGLFKFDESIAPLKNLLLQGITDTSRSAGRALAVINTDETDQALKEGLQSDDVEVRIAAIDGVRLSGNEAWCFFVLPAIEDKDANLRYYAVNTAAELGCLDVEQLKRVREHDDDEYVRLLALRWMNEVEN